MVGKRLQFGKESWGAIVALSKRRGKNSRRSQKKPLQTCSRNTADRAEGVSKRERPNTLATEEEETYMKHALVTAICLFLIGTVPASAAPQWLEDYCWDKANRGFASP
jgi:hypothetical protein